MTRCVAYFKVFICALAFLSISLAAHADPIGGYISYRHIQNDSFEISINLYRNCNGIPINTSPQVVLKQGSDSMVITLVNIPSATTEITGVCNANTSICQPGGYYPYGIQEFRSAKVVNLSAFSSATPIKAYYSDCCYLGNTNTLVPATIYIETTFMKGYAGNTAPRLRFKPNHLFLNGVPNYYSAEITNADGDSIVYAMSPVLQGPGSSVTYNTPYNSDRPLQYTGFSAYPLSFNQTTGTLVTGSSPAIIPNTILNAILSYTITRYRNGVNIGRMQVTHTVFVVANGSSNQAPALATTSGSYNVCAGSPLCIQLLSSDGNASDSTFISWGQNIAGATLSTNNARKQVGTFCWTPTAADIRPQPYYITFAVRDNNCPKTLTIYKTIAVYVNPSGTSIQANPTVRFNYCTGNVDLKANVSGNGNYSYKWYGTSGLDSDSGNVKYKYQQLGWQYYSLRISAPGFCDYVKSDSVFIPSHIILSGSVNSKPDTMVCLNSNITLSAYANGGKLPVTFNWNNGAGNGSTFTKNISTTDTIRLLITDSVGCTVNAEVIVRARLLPVVTAGIDTNVCQVDMVTLRGSPKGGEWMGAAVSNSVFMPGLASPGKQTLVYSYTDQYSCSNSDTAVYTIDSAIVSEAGTYYAMCANDHFIYLGGVPFGGKWSGPGVDVFTFDPAIAGAGIHVLSYRAPGCATTDTAMINVRALPFVYSGQDKTTCSNSPAITLVGQPATGSIWSGNGVSGKVFSPAVAGVGSHTIVQSYTDKYACSNTDTLIIHVIAAPPVNAGTDKVYCNGQGLIPIAGATPVGGYWAGLQILSGQINTNATPGIYTATYSLTQNGCSAIDTVLLKIITADFTSNVQTGAAPLTVQFSSISGSDYDNWLWDFGDPASGSNNTSQLAAPTHTYSQKGFYKVKLIATSSAGNCNTVISKPDFIQTTPNGIAGAKEQINFTVYPNPTSDSWNLLVSGAEGAYQFELVDMLGKVLMHGNGLTNQLQTYSTAGLATGIYLLRLESEGKTSQTRLMIQK